MKLNIIAITLLMASMSEARGVYRSLIQSDVTHTIESVNCFGQVGGKAGKFVKIVEVSSANGQLSMMINTAKGMVDSQVKEVVSMNSVQVQRSGEGSLTPQKLEVVSATQAKTALSISIAGSYGATPVDQEVGTVLGSTGALLDQPALVLVNGELLLASNLSCDIQFKKD